MTKGPGSKDAGWRWCSSCWRRPRAAGGRSTARTWCAGAGRGQDSRRAGWSSDPRRRRVGGRDFSTSKPQPFVAWEAARVLAASDSVHDDRPETVTAMTYRQANPIQRFLRWSVATAPMSWVYVRVLHHIDRPLYRLTRGRHSLVSLVSGLPVVMLTTTGARTRQQRVSPVVGLPDGDNLAVIASNWGSAIIPPGTTISGPVRRPRSPWGASPGASGRLRPSARSGSACGGGDWRSTRGWAAYERRVPHRRIPVMVLAPVPDTTA